jgi:hypothetical protein
MEQVATPFDLREVTVAGQKVYARPTAWDREMVDSEGRDAQDNPAVPTQFETACPECGNLVQFSADLLTVKCQNCGKGEDSRAITKAVVTAPAVVDFPNPFKIPETFA